MLNKYETISTLVMNCAYAILAGQKTVTISSSGKRPKGFPLGELLSIGTNGSRNYAVCPVKILAWIHKKTTLDNSRNL